MIIRMYLMFKRVCLCVCVCVQGSIVVGITHDCKENKVYWTDLSARTINRASMAPGAEPEILINTSKNTFMLFTLYFILIISVCDVLSDNCDLCLVSLLPVDLVSPEGLAVDVNRRLMFWVDSNPDVIESSNLDGSRRQTLFDTDLVNPRAIIVVSSTG